jgi:hypothetical protein
VLSCEEKSMSLLKVNLQFYDLEQRLIYISRDLLFYNLFRHKNGKG